MGRRPREEQNGGIYHIIQRGNNRSFVFEDDTDKEYLVDQLRHRGRFPLSYFPFICYNKINN